MAQDIADDLSCFEQHLHPFAYVLLLQNWVWSYYAVLKIRSNAELVCNEQTVMIRVAGDIQSSSRRNSGGRRLVLKPLRIPDWEYLKHCLICDFLRLHVWLGVIRCDEEGQEIGSKGGSVFTFVLLLAGARWGHISWITIIKHLSVCSSW